MCAIIAASLSSEIDCEYLLDRVIKTNVLFISIFLLIIIKTFVIIKYRNLENGRQVIERTG